MTDNWLILGASSSMARAFARAVAGRGCNVFVAGRDKDDLTAIASDLTLRGAPLAEVVPFDARNPDGWGAIRDRMAGQSGMLNVALFVGSMPEQSAIDADPGLLDGVMQDNLTGPARFLHEFAPLMEARGGGTVVGVGSVAGDRGRLGNYVYGASKAGLATYLSGLRNRLSRAGGHVVTVKPGFADTSMTWGLEGMFLVASPEKIAADILRAVDRRRNVIYTPFFWRYIMLIITHIPEFIFKKLKI